ncbi:trypsin-like peptidase domain-containing protein [Streptomyces sp. NPDC048288]|uniref:trypsin-like peptidase domain-containing protein n=1 Tax=Streptomyces sp. NPDC048288 TaxID=3365529 RepID=UPI00370FD117
MNVDTLGRQLLFCTARIDRITTSGIGTHGTGFLMHPECDGDRTYPALVTNKHVVADAAGLTARFIQKKPNADEPDLGKEVLVQFAPDSIVGHPNPAVDVAVIPLGPLWPTIVERCFVRTINLTMLATDMKDFYADAIEEITFVGYPNGHRDPKHFTPIVRRGITATPLDLDMGGDPAFLVDGSVFGGSSGSPVFLLSDGSYRTVGGGFAFGDRLALVGIIAKTMLRQAHLPVEVATAPHVKIAQELNLGVAFNARAIRETLEAAVAVGGAKLMPPGSEQGKPPVDEPEQPTAL